MRRTHRRRGGITNKGKDDKQAEVEPDFEYKRSISHLEFIQLPAGRNKKASTSHTHSFILCAQNQGSFHFCDPKSSQVARLNVLHSSCKDPTFAISKSTKLNFNGIFVVDHGGECAETFVYRLNEDEEEDFDCGDDHSFDIEDSEEL